MLDLQEQTVDPNPKRREAVCHNEVSPGESTDPAPEFSLSGSGKPSSFTQEPSCIATRTKNQGTNVASMLTNILLSISHCSQSASVFLLFSLFHLQNIR